MRFFLRVFVVLFSFFSCKSDGIKSIDTSKIEIDFLLKRYDVDFYTASKENLPNLKKEYPYLFPKTFTDSIAISKIKDKDEQELFAESQKVYKNTDDIETQLTSLFKHIKYYNTNFKTPSVITIQTNIDYDSRVIYADSLLFVSLDSYLGTKHPFYADYPAYIKQNNTKSRIVVDVANEIIKSQVTNSSNRSFIGKMVNEGKKMYLLDLYLPNVDDALKIGYSKEKLDWAIYNEEQVWMYFIEKKLLFDTSSKLNKRFLDNAPFSKFYSDQDNLSPGRIGVWLGWQIVKSFAHNNDVSLQELLTIDSEELFKKSKYKPKK